MLKNVVFSMCQLVFSLPSHALRPKSHRFLVENGGFSDFLSRVLAARQEGNSPAVIQYADKANERLRRKFYRLTLSNGKNANVAKTAIARELACFIWGMMTEHYA